MANVNVNDATPKQLVALLQLTDPEAAAVVAARPFADVAAFQRALPARVAATQPALTLAKLDVNAATAADLAKVGVPAAVAADVVAHRPYYDINDVAHVTGVTADLFQQLSDVYAVGDLGYVDKASGRRIQLTSSADQVLVHFSDTESEQAHAMIKSSGLVGVHAKGSEPYQVYASPGAGPTNPQTMTALRGQSGVLKALPSFVDQDGERRYLDPEYCSVQFMAGVSDDRALAIIKDAGLEVQQRYRSPGLFTLHVPAGRTDPAAVFGAVARLDHYPEVKFAEPSYLGFDDWDAGGEGTEGVALRWNLEQIHVEDAWRHGRGTPAIVLAVIDSGVDVDHPSLADAILPRGPDQDWNFDSDESAPTDEEGHGTFIAGLLIGNGKLGVQGVCPYCRLLPIRVPTSAGEASYARRRDGILFALSLVPPDGRMVMNLSWKTSGDVALIRDAIALAISRGVIVVASAGNSPERINQPHYPSDYPGVLSVAGVLPDGRRAGYSFYGDRIDLAAPAGTAESVPDTQILSAVPGGGTGTQCGTSFAAPHVAGVAALILSQKPSATPDDVRAFLASTATPIVDVGVGHGIVNAGAAVSAAQSASAIVVVPSPPSDPTYAPAPLPDAPAASPIVTAPTQPNA